MKSPFRASLGILLVAVVHVSAMFWPGPPPPAPPLDQWFKPFEEFRQLVEQIHQEEDSETRTARYQRAQKTLRDAAAESKAVMEKREPEGDALQRELEQQMKSKDSEGARAAKRRLAARIEEVALDKTKAQLQYFAAQYWLARTYARSDAEQNRTRVLLLKSVLVANGPNSLPLFAWEYAHYDLGLHGNLLMGLVHRELGDHDRSIKAFDAAWSRKAPTFYGDRPRQMAYYEKAVTQFRIGAYEDARKTVDDLLNEYLVLLKDELGLAAWLLKARCYAAEGRALAGKGEGHASAAKYQAAIVLAKHVASIESGVRTEAERLITKWAEQMGALPPLPEEEKAAGEKGKTEDEIAKRHFQSASSARKASAELWAKAIAAYERRAAYYEKLPEEHPDRPREWLIKYELAKCYEATSMRLRAIELFYEVKDRLAAGSDSWWDAVYSICSLRLFQAKRYWVAGLSAKCQEELKSMFALMRATHESRPAMGDPELKRRFRGLVSEAGLYARGVSSLSKEAYALSRSLWHTERRRR